MGLLYAWDALFATPALEEQFRRLVMNNADVEIGGYLLGSMRLPGGIQYRTWKRVVKSEDYPITIHNWILVPNQSDTPQNRYVQKDTPHMKEVAEITARSLELPFIFHFHTHPAGVSLSPSNHDIAFALRYCEEIQGQLFEFAIAQAYPLRVMLVSVRRRKAPDGKNESLEIGKGLFWSWREKAIRGLLR